MLQTAWYQFNLGTEEDSCKESTWLTYKCPWQLEAPLAQHPVSLQELMGPELLGSQNSTNAPVLARAPGSCSDFIYGNCTTSLIKKSFQMSLSDATS